MWDVIGLIPDHCRSIYFGNEPSLQWTEFAMGRYVQLP